MKRLSKMHKFFWVVSITISSTLCGSDIPLEQKAKMENKSIAVVKNFVKKYQNGAFTYITDGHFANTSTEDVFGIWVTSNRKVTLEIGKALAIDFLNAYFLELRTNQDVLSWYKELTEWHPKRYNGNLGLKNIRIRIAFWDENVERPKAPYLSEIDFAYGKFHYYEADPETQALKLVLEEPYTAGE